jgi:Na+/H+ antiporter NhaD/arsenite permease-like protein
MALDCMSPPCKIVVGKNSVSRIRCRPDSSCFLARMSADLTLAFTLMVFIATYVVVAIGKLPGYRIDRAGAALLGGSVLVGAGVLTPQEAYNAVDIDTIVLLLGMMIVVANLRVSGFFRVVNAFIARRVHRPITLLLAVAGASGFLSAFLVNDTICLVMTPLVTELTLRMKRNPVPYLLAIAMCSNIGSVATITGNPQNMIIGSLSHVSYGAFAASLAPIAAFGLVAAVTLIVALHRGEFLAGGRLPAIKLPAHYHRPLMVKTLVILAAMIALFFIGQPVAEVAIVGGAFLLLTRRVSPSKIYRQIDWPLLVMFTGLFIVVAALEKVAIGPEAIEAVGRIRLDDVAVLSAITAVLSNVVSNVPAVLVLKPFVEPLADPQRAWLIVAMASTLAGNFTLVGSVANLIVAERARAHGATLGFWAYFRVGAPLTVLTTLAGIAWMSL